MKSDDLPKYLPADLVKYALASFATKSPPYHVGLDGISTLPEHLEVGPITGHQLAPSRGGFVAIVQTTHRTGFLRPSWERKQKSRAAVGVVLSRPNIYHLRLIPP